MLHNPAANAGGVMSKIAKARVVANRTPVTNMFDLEPGKVFVTFEGETEEQELLQFYPDEIDFRPSEFVGLSRDEALQLRHNRDDAYLRS